MRWDERVRLVIAIPARWREVGLVLDIREEVSESSDWSSASRRESWVVAKEEMSTAVGGAISGKRSVRITFEIGVPRKFAY